MARLGVNIDHVATLRQARGTTYPDPLAAARAAEAGGADGITVHLREDRRHIQDTDVARLRGALRVPLNLEMAATAEMVAIALGLRPADVCLVPERRAEVTTEGGLDVVGQRGALADVVARSRRRDPGEPLHRPGAGARSTPPPPSRRGRRGSTPAATARITARRDRCRARHLRRAAEHAHGLGMIVNAGHGLRLDNVRPIAELPHMDVLNIGHSIVARAVFVGMEEAVREMRALVVA
jgi:pyridoxine 5-phosphate synthase